MFGNLTPVYLDEPVPCSAHPGLQIDEALLIQGAEAFGLRLGQKRQLLPGQ
jgi:hypothetical protein